MHVAIAHGQNALFVFEHLSSFFIAFGKLARKLADLLVDQPVLFFDHRSFI